MSGMGTVYQFTSRAVAWSWQAGIAAEISEKHHRTHKFGD
ncbi:hypothetical protein Rhow_001629 [Rhodococcus wratislaviensis]|uniref:Uncharacterized protein n=1 Tax=Rhodococcus wratislaviensis TaxID=44752 RepID=A0A402BXX8_RHOWR|nr:hypothetical protein Rhow_001629 [Rhodococcus wratislaviensis]